MSINQAKKFETEVDIPQNVNVTLKNFMMRVKKI